MSLTREGAIAELQRRKAMTSAAPALTREGAIAELQRRKAVSPPEDDFKWGRFLGEKAAKGALGLIDLPQMIGEKMPQLQTTPVFDEQGNLTGMAPAPPQERISKKIERKLKDFGVDLSSQKPTTGAQRIAGTAADFLGSTLGGAGIGAAAKAKGLTNIGNMMGAPAGAKDLAKLAGVGAASGAGAQSLTEAGVSEPYATLASSFATPMLLSGASGIGSKFASAAKGRFKPEHAELMEASAKHGIDVLPGDISTTGMLPKVSYLAEKVPGLNILKDRERQMAQSREAAQKMVSMQRDKMNLTEFGGKDGYKKLQEVAGSDGKRSSKARELLEDIQNSDDDWNKIIQTSGNVSLFKKKLKADELGDKVETLASQFGAVPEINTEKAIRDAVKEASSQRLPDSKTLNLLQDLESTIGTPNTYSDLRKFRSSLSRRIDDYYRSGQLIGSEGVQYLQSVKNAIDKDMQKFALSQSPELHQAYKEFNSYYKNQVVPYKDRQLARVLSSSDPEDVYSTFTKLNHSGEGKGHGRADRFYKALDDKGREAVKSGMLQNALDSAYNAETNHFSPAKFKGFIKQNQPIKSKFFNEVEKKDLDGFTKILAHVERSGQTKGEETGMKTIPFIIGIGSYLMGTPGIGTGTLASAAALKTTMGSTKFAKFLASESVPMEFKTSLAPFMRTTTPPNKEKD